MNFEMKNENGIYELYIYDEIKPDRFNWEGELIESKTDAIRIKEQIDSIPDGSTINLYISSNGGDVKTGLAIYSQLARKDAVKTAYIDGFACSIASVIPMACNKIVMYPTSLMMIHCASGGFYGNADEHRRFADDLDVISDSATNAYLSKAGDKLNREVLDRLLKAESWLSASDCLKYGLCDEVVVPTADNKIKINQCNNTYLSMCAKIGEVMMSALKADEEKKAEDVADKVDVEDKKVEEVEDKVDVNVEDKKVEDVEDKVDEEKKSEDTSSDNKSCISDAVIKLYATALLDMIKL